MEKNNQNIGDNLNQSGNLFLIKKQLPNGKWEIINRTPQQLIERQQLQKIKIASLPKDENYTSEKKTLQELFPNVFDSNYGPIRL